MSAQPFLVKHFTTDDGLAHNVGFEIYQDKKGLIWIGTDNGLCNFDGTKFQTYYLADGLNHSSIITIWEDLAGEMYVGPHRMGVNRISDAEISDIIIDHKLIRNPQVFSLPDGKMIIKDLHPKSNEFLFARGVLSEDSIGLDYWILTEKEGKAVLLSAKDYGDLIYRRAFLSATLSETYNLLDAKIFQDSKGEIYFLTQIGCWRLLDDEKLSLEEAFPAQLPHTEMLVMSEDPEGGLWLASNQFLFHVIAGKMMGKYPLPAEIKSPIQLETSRKGKQFMLDADRRTLLFYDPVSQQSISFKEKMNLFSEVSFIQLDLEGNLWATTMGDGLFMIRDQYFINYQFEEANRSSVTDIDERPNGDIWFATRKGFSIFKDEKWIHLNTPNVNGKGGVTQIEALNWIDESILLYHYLEKLWRFNYETGVSDLLNEKAFPGLAKTADGQFVLVESVFESAPDIINVKLNYLNDKGVLEDVRGIPVNQIPRLSPRFSYLETPQQEIWFSIAEGLFKVEGDEVMTFGETAGLPSIFINDITLDKEERLWIATEKGIAYQETNDTNTFKLFTALLDLPIRKLVFDKKGDMWLGTPKGLFRWDGILLEQFNTSNGLVGNDVTTLYLDSKGILWVGTSQGISKLDTEVERPPNNPPNLIVNSVQLGELNVSDSTDLFLKSNQNITWQYSCLNYSNPQGVRFRHRLNAESDWTYTTNTTFTLSNINPGIYQFELEARTTQSIWGSTYQYAFTVLPSWWRRIWVIVLGVILLISLISGLFYLRLRNIKNRERRKRYVSKRMAELELKALEAQINPHFIFNALNAIQSFILDNDTDSSHLYLTRFAKLMRMFLESSRKSEHPLDDEIEMLRYYIEMEQLCYQGRFNYEITVEDQLPLVDINVPAMLIQPFVENAIRHGLLHKTKGLGFLNIKFEESGDRILCTITDNGIGRKNMDQLQKRGNHMHVSRGMQIINERLQLQAGLDSGQIQIVIDDLDSEETDSPGTKVQIYLPA
ncbi:MAG: two-component regulator propeller domain-containing protein [Bacteroidia bacterium]